MQALVGFDGGSMVAVLPERAPLVFALIVPLCDTAADELLCDNFCTGVFDQQMVCDWVFTYSRARTDCSSSSLRKANANSTVDRKFRKEVARFSFPQRLERNAALERFERFEPRQITW
jgi:hypothetical protein